MRQRNQGYKLANGKKPKARVSKKKKSLVQEFMEDIKADAKRVDEMKDFSARLQKGVISKKEQHELYEKRDIPLLIMFFNLYMSCETLQNKIVKASIRWKEENGSFLKSILPRVRFNSSYEDTFVRQANIEAVQTALESGMLSDRAKNIARDVRKLKN